MPVDWPEHPPQEKLEAFLETLHIAWDYCRSGRYREAHLVIQLRTHPKEGQERWHVQIRYES